MSNFNHIQIDPAIAGIVDKALANERAVLTAKREHRRYARKRNIAQGREQVKSNLLEISADSYEIARIRANEHIMPIEHKKNMFPSNTIKMGFNDYMQDWHRSARTGETGKRAARPPANDHRYSAHPYVPYTK